MTIELPFVDYTTCVANSPVSFRRYITSDKFCAGLLDGTSSCEGDSGSGLVFNKPDNNGMDKYYIYGIASLGPNHLGGCDITKYRLFTKVNDYINMILDSYEQYLSNSSETSETTDSSDLTSETSSALSSDVTESTNESTGTEETSSKHCSQSTYECCPDGITEATGENHHGCEAECHSSEFGCCSDNKTNATGPNKEGCAACLTEQFGCCPDNLTPAHGQNNEGCCLESQFGCCPDNVIPAEGPTLEGCGCEHSAYGCCPDNKTAAKGHYQEGCGCKHSPHGCCPDQLTPAEGENNKGCLCHTFQSGCCPDGVTIPNGPHHYGCYCSQSEFQCCSDEVTKATGPNFEGCTCATSKYGCCADGVTEAQGKNFEGCAQIPTTAQASCGLPKDAGTFCNFTIKYFFDISYGACSKFWYRGCDGNDNRFEKIEDCRSVCEEATGKELCSLPKSAGPCADFAQMWYFDSERKACSQFLYGGCWGNTNRFETLQECQKSCSADQSLPTCKQPVEEGPCNGTFERWYFDESADECLSFNYGGCKANKNNFVSQQACKHNCKTPGVMRASTLQLRK